MNIYQWVLMNIFEHDYCEETKRKMREIKPLLFIKWLGEHRKECSRCFKAIEKYKTFLKERYKTQKAPDVLGMGD